MKLYCATKNPGKLREFEAESQAGTQPEAEGFLTRLKDFWKACEK